MTRVTGIGGIFFQCEDPAAMNEWYGKHLGLPVTQWGASFGWRDEHDPEKKGMTQWSAMKKDTDYFSPSKKPFMINYRVENLAELIETLKAEGVQVVGEIQEFEYGKFGWILDPEGNKIELWEPPAEEKL
ncbi:VOC family protein [Chitinophaga sp. GCM10012297]|uniref:VOC family protein n=1 Tax=Chitinophaga chungangae TaxID=2821488 RepID=A0ABS3YK77_9BACT|nr:VOC family protein [Chitinophaga chungangae]MBO9155088.1 VOC family protein [Chitinophaga chungangae]